ncbi:copper resistance CopC family protein [Cellulomonas sp. McL0617]|uniref:copper resistance CopC family protein n=1 Tax=Cellulomonas sp. McL0617 TaxID=3415675 RepID=UPI003CF8FEDE
MRAPSIRALLVVGLGLVLGLTGAGAAEAHNVLRSTDPADGSTIAVAPAQVTLTFDEPALALGTEIEVRDPAGTLVSAGDAVLVDATVSEELAGDLPAGRYTVAWRVTSADGHPITGQLSFTTTGATTIGGATTDSPTTDSPTPSDAGDEQSTASGGGNAPVIVAGVLAVIAAAAVVWWLLRRGRRGAE